MDTSRDRGTPRDDFPTEVDWLQLPASGVVQRVERDGSITSVVDPRTTITDRRLTQAARASLAAEAAAKLLASIREDLLSADPIDIFVRFEAWQRLLRRLPVEQVYGYEALVEFVGGLVCTFDQDDVNAARTRRADFAGFMALERQVRLFANADAEARAGDFYHQPELPSETRFMLAVEEQFDRMTGYVQHLRRIAQSVLGRTHDAASAELGFGPLDAIAAADAVLRAQELQSQRGIRDLRAAEEASGSPRRNSMAGAELLLGQLVPAIRLDPLPIVAEAFGWDLARAERLLEALSTSLGSQRVSRLSSTNDLRLFPILKVGPGEFVWTCPNDFLHVALDWYDELLLRRDHRALRKAHHRARAKGTEQLVTQTFATVFGERSCSSNVELQATSGEWSETDLVVRVGDLALVVEAKSHRVTPPGRRGASGRVRAKQAEFVTRPDQQTARAREGLLAGQPVRDRRGSPIGLSAPAFAHRIVVHLDRVDPLVTFVRDELGSARSDLWMVSLADLLVVADLLDDPVSFLGYVDARVAQTVAGAPLVFMETDALGAWLRSRERDWEARERVVAQLAFSSADINRYYTEADGYDRWPDLFGAAPAKPSHSIPAAVLDALERLVEEPGWGAACIAVAHVPPRRWRDVLSDLTRAGREARSRNDRRLQARAARGRLVSPAVHVRIGNTPALAVGAEGMVELTVSPAGLLRGQQEPPLI